MNFFSSLYFATLCGWRFVRGDAAQLIFDGVPDWYVEEVAEGPKRNLLVAMANRELIRREAAAQTPGTPEFQRWVDEDKFYE